MKSARKLVSDLYYIFEREDEEGNPLPDHNPVSMEDLEFFTKLVQRDAIKSQLDKLSKRILLEYEKANKVKIDNPMSSIHLAFADLLKTVEKSMLKDLPKDPFSS